MRINKIKFSVIVDTNILRGKPIRSELTEFVEFCKSKPNVEFALLIPEIVKKEYHKYFTDKIIEARNNALNGLSWIDSLLEVKTKDLLPEIKVTSKDSENILSKLDIHIISTPHTEIDLEQLIDNAVNHFPPFQESKEKGFKDSIILETVMSVVGQLSRTGSVFFVTDDELLRKTFEDRTSRYKRFKIYQSIPDLESDIKLLLETFDTKFISKVTNQATKSFYDPVTSAKSLYTKWRIRDRIISQFRDLIYSPKPQSSFADLLSSIAYGPENWVPKTEGKFSVSNSIFSRKTNSGMYLWQNTVVFEQTIQNTSVLRSQASKSLRLYKAEFNISWESEIGTRGIIKPNFVEITHKSTSSEEIYEPTPLSDYLISTPTSGATLSGQGTVPAASDVSGDYVSPYLEDLGVSHSHIHDHTHLRSRGHAEIVNANATIDLEKISGTNSSKSNS